jgi:hypothetical protein
MESRSKIARSLSTSNEVGWYQAGVLADSAAGWVAVATLDNPLLDLPMVAMVVGAILVEASVVALAVVAEASEEAFAAAIVGLVGVEVEAEAVSVIRTVVVSVDVVLLPLMLPADPVVDPVGMAAVVIAAGIGGVIVAATMIVAMAMAAVEGIEEGIDQEAAAVMDVIEASRAAIANLSVAEIEATKIAIDVVTMTMAAHESDTTRATMTIPGSVVAIEHLALAAVCACFYHITVLLSAISRYGWLVYSTSPLVFLASTPAVFPNG